MRIVSLVRLSPEAAASGGQSQRLREDCSLYPVKFGKMMKNRLHASFDCLSMAPLNHSSHLGICHEYGAEDVYLLCDKHFAGSDTYATSHILAQALQSVVEPFDLLACFMQSSQGQTGHMAGALAARLQMPAAIGVVEICEVNADSIICVQNHDYYEETVRIRLPAVISLHHLFRFDEGADHITLFDMKKAQKKTVQVLTREALGMEPGDCGLAGSKTRMLEGKRIAMKRQHADLEGSMEEQCRMLFELIER